LQGFLRIRRHGEEEFSVQILCSGSSVCNLVQRTLSTANLCKICAAIIEPECHSEAFCFSPLVEPRPEPENLRTCR
jgi:hypothetical protein